MRSSFMICLIVIRVNKDFDGPDAYEGPSEFQGYMIKF